MTNDRLQRGKTIDMKRPRKGEWDPGAGGAKISARGNGYHFAGWIAPDLSHACGLHRPGYDRSPASPNPAAWYINGALPNRPGTGLAASPILGAPGPYSHRARVSFCPCPTQRSP